MENQDINQAKEELLKKEAEQNALTLKYKARQKMKVYALIAIGVFF